MNLTEEARRLLTCKELRGRVPKEVQEFLRRVAGLEPFMWYCSRHDSFINHNTYLTYKEMRGEDDIVVRRYDTPLYTLEPRHASE